MSIRVAVQEIDIDVGAELMRLEQCGGGAVASFTGLVRADHDMQRLELETYASMAMAALDEVAQMAMARWSLRGATIIHRNGSLAIGDRIVLVAAAAAAAHRAAALVACSGLSVAHFSGAFRDTTGTTPHRWLIQRRVSKSVGLLKDSGLRLVEIALMCGFADHSHLTQTFTKIVGVSPSAYRRALGKGDDDAIQDSIDALRRSGARELGARSWTSSIRLTTQQ